MRKIIKIDYSKDRLFESIGENETESIKMLDRITEKYYDKTIAEGSVNKFDIMKEINETFSDEQVLAMATMMVSDKVVELLKKEAEKSGAFIVGTAQNEEAFKKYASLKIDPVFGPILAGMPDGMKEVFLRMLDQKYSERNEKSKGAPDGSYEAYVAHMAKTEGVDSDVDAHIDREPPLRRDGDGDND